MNPDIRLNLDQATRWLAKFEIASEGEHWKHFDEKVRYFLGVLKALNDTPAIASELEAMLLQCGTSELVQQFLKACDEATGGFVKEAASCCQPFFRTAIEPFDVAATKLRDFATYGSTHLVPSYHSPPTGFTEKALALRHSVEKLLNRSLDFGHPELEVAILYVYGSLLSNSALTTFYPLIANGVPFHFTILHQSADAVLNALEYRFARQASVHSVLQRFQTYVEWFHRRDVTAKIEKVETDYYDEYVAWKNGDLKTKPRYLFEKPVHEFINDFFFTSGFFPIVNFTLLGDEPDTLALPDGPRAHLAGSPLLIEVKQLISPKLRAGLPRPEEKTVTADFLGRSLNQLVNYMEKLKAATSIGLRDGALVVFYNSAKPVAGVIPNLFVFPGYQISVLLVYLGDGHASDCSDVVRLDTWNRAPAP